MIQIFGGVAIGIALVFLLLLFKKHVLKSEEGAYDGKILEAKKDDAFVEIPAEVITDTLLRNKSTSVHELQEKIRKFKSRNRFYKY